MQENWYSRTLPVGILSLGGGRPDPLPLEPAFAGNGRAPPGRLGGVGADMTSERLVSFGIRPAG
jgi:hypothetical protein